MASTSVMKITLAAFILSNFLITVTESLGGIATEIGKRLTKVGEILRLNVLHF